MFKDSLFHRPAGDCARNAENNSREAVVRRCSVETVFIKISQNSQENTCARVSFKSFFSSSAYPSSSTNLQNKGSLQLY